RLRAPVAADVEVPALVGRDDAEVLALRLRALTNAAADGRLQLVRGAQALVAILDADREADGVLHALATPGRADAALHGAQRLAVGVAALEASVDELLPDVGEVSDVGAEQIHALAARDLRVETEALGDLAEDDELVGGDLPSRHARHDGVQPLALDVREEAV